MHPARFFRLFLAVALLLPAAAFGDTAYQALRTIGSQRSQTLLGKVISVRGANGAPQPQKWIVLVDDPQARGGVREFEIAQAKILSERTPVRPGGLGSPMDFSKLNLDSDGAFVAAENEARASNIGYFSVDFLLQSGTRGTPVWVLQYLDEQGTGIASITIAADTGIVLSRNIKGKDYQGSARTSGSGGSSGGWSSGGGLKGRLHRAGDAVSRSVHHAEHKLKRFWSGDE